MKMEKSRRIEIFHSLRDFSQIFYDFILFCVKILASLLGHVSMRIVVSKELCEFFHSPSTANDIQVFYNPSLWRWMNEKWNAQLENFFFYFLKLLKFFFFIFGDLHGVEIVKNCRAEKEIAFQVPTPTLRITWRKCDEIYGFSPRFTFWVSNLCVVKIFQASHDREKRWHEESAHRRPFKSMEELKWSVNANNDNCRFWGFYSCSYNLFISTFPASQSARLPHLECVKNSMMDGILSATTHEIHWEKKGKFLLFLFFR